MSPDFLIHLGDSARMVMFGVIALMALAGALHAFLPNWPHTLKIARTSFIAGCTGLFYCLGVLVTLFVNHAFQFRYVARHSRLNEKIEYLVAGVWSGQEGSFLLWAVCSALFGVIAVRFARQYERWFTVVYALFLGSLAGILSFESPFYKFAEGAIVTDGAGISPNLANYWVVIHPPTIFLGFGSLTVLFAWAMAAMLHRDLNEWVKMARPWAILGLTLLGLGLCMGGFWAYELLGWGGFWMWDPVENTSFVPWVALAAFIHGVFVQLGRNKWHVLNALLAGLPFVLFCYGTFLTRSGFLGDTSVHSFAQMDSTALWLLTGIGAVALISLVATSIVTANWLKYQEVPKTTETPLNRESLYGVGMWLLVIMGLFVAIGMSLPFLTGTILGNQIQIVEEKLYHQVLAWPYPFIALLIAVTPFVTWRGITSRELGSKIINTLAVSIGLVGFALLWLKWAGSEIVLGRWAVLVPGVPVDPERTVNFFPGLDVNATVWVLFLSWITAFAVLANLNRGLFHLKRSKLGFGGHLTHVGLMLTMVGLIFSRGFEQKVEMFVHPTIPTERRMAFGYEVDLVGKTIDYTNRENKIEFTLNNGREQFTALPGLYFMAGNDGAPQQMRNPFILSRPLYDLYVVVHQFSFAGSEPTPLVEAETARFNNILVTFEGLRREGEVGMAGTKFYADTIVQTPEGTRRVSPYFEIPSEPGIPPERPSVPINDELALRLDRIDAATGEAYVVVDYRTEMFPVDVYYKPLTVLVWWGVGIMTLGGLVAAWSRRYRPKPPTGQNPPGQAENQPAETEEQTDDAPQQLAQV